jgi:hypothetical protein
MALRAGDLLCAFASRRFNVHRTNPALKIEIIVHGKWGTARPQARYLYDPDPKGLRIKKKRQKWVKSNSAASFLRLFIAWRQQAAAEERSAGLRHGIA